MHLGTSRRHLAVLVLGAFLASGSALVPTTAGAGPGTDPAPGARSAPPGKDGSPLSPRLQALAAGATARTSVAGVAKLAGLPAEGAGSIVRSGDGAVHVNARLTAVDGATEAALVRAGAKIVARSVADHLVTLAVEPTQLDGLRQVPAVEWIEEVLEPMVHGGGVGAAGLGEALDEAGATTNAACGDRKISEADTQLGVATARTMLSVNGSGVRVGVLSDSYDNLGGSPTDVANGELPGAGNPCGFTTPVTLQSDLASGGSDEGRAMAQAVHDLAPGSPISVATAFVSDVDFADQIRTLATNGAKVIVDDISYFNEPIYQDGIISKAVRDVTASGVTYFSSAANSNAIVDGKDISSYEAAAYRPMACPATIVAPPYAEDDCHDWNPGGGTDDGNDITVPNGGRLMLKLGWNEPQYGITSDLDVFVVDTVTGNVVAVSNQDNPFGSKQAFEFVNYTNNTGVTRTFKLVIGRYDSSTTPKLKVIYLRSGGATSVQWNTSSGTDIVGPTSYGHNMVRGAGSIAALPYDDNTAPETYSSRGPATTCWNPVVGTTAATALSPCQVDTIDVTATDGGANSFFGVFDSPVWRFYGTSQAAPHAAAVAALQKQYRPCATPAQILRAQRFSGVAIGTFGVDAIGGGRLSAGTAIGGLPSCAVGPAWSPFASWTALVNRLYTDMLGRSPTSSERTSWVTQLTSGSKKSGDLAAALRTTTDHLANVDPVTRLYRAYFLRIPDKGGLTYWIGKRRTGTSINAISSTFASSTEFTNRYGSLTNRAFVNLVYTNVLGRAGEPSGVNYWTAQLDQGKKSRGQVMVGFSESNEYKSKQTAEVDVSVYWILLLGRGPTAAEFNTLTAQLDGHTITSAGVANDLLWSRAYSAHIEG